MWLLIIDNNKHILVCDYFPDAFLFEVIAMYLEEDGIYGEDRDIALKAFQNGTTFMQSKNYTFTLIEADEAI